MKNFLLFTSFILLLGCNRTEDTPYKNVIESAIYVYLTNGDGSDLIGTNNYNSQTISVKYLDPACSNKNYYYIDTDLQGHKFIKILLNTGLDTGATENVSTETVVKWNNNDSNTFRADVKKVKGETEYSIMVEKVYLDGQLVCPDAKNRTITIKK